MTSLQHILGVPERYKEYELSPLTLIEWAKLAVWMQYHPYRQAIEAELPEDECKEIKEECKNTKLDLTSPDFLNGITSPECAYKLIQLSLSIKHPEFRLYKIKEVIEELDLGRNNQTARNLQEKILKLSLGEDVMTSENDEENPT